MIKRMLLALAVAALVSPMALADVGNTNPADLVGIFEYNQDIGGPEGIGFTMDMGVGISSEYPDDRAYLITAGGADIWGNWDEFHMAYNMVSGDVRLSAEIDKLAISNYWGKYGVMFRASADGDAVNYSSMTRRNEDKAIWHWRSTTGGGSGSDQGPNVDVSGATFGIQRITVGSDTIVQGLIDYNTGNGWEVRGTVVNPDLPDEMLAGVILTSHIDTGLAQVIVRNVMYETDDIGVIGIPTLEGDPIDQCSEVPGFKIRVRKFENAEWRNGLPDDAAAFQKGEDLMAGIIPPYALDLDIAALGIPGRNELEGTRIDPIVNLNQDDGDAGAFGDDSHFPGIDLFKEDSSVTGFGDDNDGDDDFAVEVIACIYLTEGAHILGANGDDGTKLEVGGIEIGRTEAWKGASNRDFLFTVAQEGFYSFRALHIGGGGGENLELHEVLPDGTRILLGATDETGAFIGSPVYAPEPATIALLGLGGLSLIRRKRS